MNFINSVGPFSWIVLLSIPPLIVLLYFLKLKRTPLVVPSTYLWSRTIEDLHVNTIWQRLRQSLLLWLQLLFILLLILAVLRPGGNQLQNMNERLILLIDQSASMSAKTDSKDRLSLAKEKALELIDAMGPESVAMIIAFSDEARVVQSYTNNRALLRRKVAEIEPTDHLTNLDQAIQAAAGLANPPQTYEEGNPNALRLAQELRARMILLTDGGVEANPETPLGNLQPEYIPIGIGYPIKNFGITSFTTSENPERPQQIQAFAQLLNASDKQADVDFELFLNDALIDARVGEAFDPEETKTFTFDLPANLLEEINSGVLELRLSTKDDLAVDNRAFAVFNTRKQARILVVTPGNDALELALQTSEIARFSTTRIETPQFLESETYRQLTDTTALDLVIYDRCQPDKMPLANTLFWSSLPPEEGWSVGELASPVVLIDSDQTHPLVEWLQLGEILVVEGRPVDGPPGTYTLIRSNVGSMLSVGQRLGFQDAVLGFPLVSSDEDGTLFANSDWPRHPSFPMFIQNLVNHLGNAAGLNAVKTYRPGDPVELRTVLPRDEIEVTDPKGRKRRISRGRQNLYSYPLAEQLGVYSVDEDMDGKPDQRFAVHLVNLRESSIQVPSQLKIGYEDVEGVAGKQLGRREFWKWLLLAALLVLAIEWYVYNRRVYI